MAIFFGKNKNKPLLSLSKPSISLQIKKEGEDKLLSVSEFEALFQTQFIPGLDFSDFSLQKKILKLHRQNRLSREQLWWGSYFQKELTHFSLPPIEIRWIDARIGWGVFAVESIPKMTLIGEYGGKVRKRVKADTKNAYCFEYTLAEGYDSPYIIDARDQGGIVRYINHSSTPNLLSKLATYNGVNHIILITKSPISKGVQLLYDYGPNYWAHRPCPDNLN
jgi:hypothetical protein